MQKSLFLYKQNNRKDKRITNSCIRFSKQEFVINRHDSYIFKRLQKKGIAYFSYF